MVQKRYYEIVYDRFHKRWVFKPQGLPGALKVGRTKEDCIKVAIPVCNNMVCTLLIHQEDGTLEEERLFGGNAHP